MSPSTSLSVVRRRSPRAPAAIAWGAAFASVCVPFVVVAQDARPMPDLDPSMLGIGVARVPDYEGGRGLHTEVFPVVNVKLPTAYGVVTLGGDNAALGNTIPLAAWTVTDGPFSFGALTDYDGGRRDDQSGTTFHSGSRVLHGLGRLPGALEYGLAASYVWGFAEPGITVRRAVGHSGHGGTVVDFNVDFTLPLSERVAFIVSPTATWTSRRYQQSYFGVTAAQSVASGFAEYHPSSGLKSYALTITPTYRFSTHWLGVANFTTSRLASESADSPIVQRRTVFVPSLSVVYTW